MEERLEQAAGTIDPNATGTILAHGLPLLLQIVDSRWERGATAPFRGIELVLESAEGRLAISLCNHNNMVNLAAHLRRLRDQLGDRVLEETDGERCLLLRDVRLPISAKSRKTREYREELLRQGFHWVEVTAEMVTAIDALRRLLSEAKAGDLANGGESIPESEVQAWVRANLSTRLRPLRDLLELILPTTSGNSPGEPEVEPDFNLCQDISELLALHHLLTVEYLAMRLDHEEATIEACARNNPERFGLLSGPPAILFQLTLDAPPAPALIDPHGAADGGYRERGSA